jgi:hypothetical protein
MNMDNEAEKLDIAPDKIIHILLKHLMVLKNENAFLKNYASIHSYENSIPEKNIGIKSLLDGIAEKNIGIKTPLDDTTQNNIGIKSSQDGIPEKIIGIKSSLDDILQKNIGIKSPFYGIPENNIGIKPVLEALPALNEGANADILLYSVFEQGLLNALNEYIKTGDGQNTLYNYYTDFVEAVAEKNLAASKIKEAEDNLPIEDTHTLPRQIMANDMALSKLRHALHGHLPRTSKWDLYENIALELLLLHNAGKATGTQLRKSAGLSIGGFAKHLPKLKRSGLIKNLPPSNYVLTSSSTHILLKTFGVPKDN